MVLIIFDYFLQSIIERMTYLLEQDEEKKVGVSKTETEVVVIFLVHIEALLYLTIPRHHPQFDVNRNPHR